LYEVKLIHTAVNTTTTTTRSASLDMPAGVPGRGALPPFPSPDAEDPQLDMTEPLDDEIKARYLQRGTIAGIAAAVGISQGEVRRSLRRSNVPIRRVGASRRPGKSSTDSLDPQAVIARYEAGHSATALAEAYGVPYTTVRNLLVSHGVALRRPYPGPDRGLIVGSHFPRLDQPQPCPHRRDCAKTYHPQVTEDRCPCCHAEFSPGTSDSAWTPLPLADGHGRRRLSWRKTLTDAGRLLCQPVPNRWSWQHLDPAGAVVFSHTAATDWKAKRSAEEYLAYIREGGNPAHEGEQRGPIWRCQRHTVALSAPQLRAAYHACAERLARLATAGASEPALTAAANAVAVIAQRIHDAGLDPSEVSVPDDEQCSLTPGRSPDMTGPCN